jgi:hypothetical protein
MRTYLKNQFNENLLVGGSGGRLLEENLKPVQSPVLEKKKEREKERGKEGKREKRRE